MPDPYLGEIRMFAGNFPPNGWMFCDGQILNIADGDNETLYNLIGTTYGGDGIETFALPDLRGRIPLHQSNMLEVGQMLGVEEVTLTLDQIPAHSHAALANTQTAQNTAAQQNALAAMTSDAYVYTLVPVDCAATVIAPIGGSQPHSNFQPYLCVNFIISMYGTYPLQW
jgi:microcystin-dependent protein